MLITRTGTRKDGRVAAVAIGANKPEKLESNGKPIRIPGSVDIVFMLSTKTDGLPVIAVARRLVTVPEARRIAHDIGMAADVAEGRA